MFHKKNKAILSKKNYALSLCVRLATLSARSYRARFEGFFRVKDAPLILTPKAWFFEPGQSRHRRDCRNRMPWGTGIMECWNTGFGGMRSIFI